MNIQLLLSTKEWHFGLKKAWRKTQMLLKYASLTWQFTAWQANQMLTPESFALQLLLPAMCCQQILLCHLNTLFPKPSTCHIFHLMLSVCSYNESSWMDYIQSEFFHGSSNGLILNICSHTRSNWIIYHCCGFFNVPSNIFVTVGAAEWFITSVGSFMSLVMAWHWTFEVTLGATEWFFNGVNSFMSLYIVWCWGMGANEGFITFLGSFLCKFKINLCVLSSMLKIELTYRYIKCCS